MRKKITPGYTIAVDSIVEYRWISYSVVSLVLVIAGCYIDHTYKRNVLHLMCTLLRFIKICSCFWFKYSKTCVKRPLSKRPNIGFQYQLSLSAGQKYCRKLQGEHSALLSTFIKLPFIIMFFVLSIFESSFYTGFTLYFI